MREPRHPEECGPCPECAEYLEAKGFTLASYIGGKPTDRESLEAMGYEVIKVDRESSVGKRRRAKSGTS